MKYYSTNKQAPVASLQEAVVKGLAADKGLFMPMSIKPLPQEFYDTIDTLSFQEIAYRVADAFFGEDIPADTLKQIVYDTLSFDVPLVKVADNIYSLELFHGPTLAFKDVGGRFMARLLGYFIKKEGQKNVNVLVATSGDTGSAVANGFLGVDGIHVYVLYPKGKVSEIQEKQFTTLGQNITALEVDGTFDDCQALVKAAFMDKELNEHLSLTSANSINVARFLPQAFYYFYAYAQLKRAGKADNAVINNTRLIDSLFVAFLDNFKRRVGIGKVLKINQIFLNFWPLAVHEVNLMVKLLTNRCLRSYNGVPRPRYRTKGTATMSHCAITVGTIKTRIYW